MPDYQLYWGDVHNHNQLGYAQGSLERSYEIARSHLDFYCFTPHGQHCDGGAPEGYPIVNENWHRIQAAAAENNEPGVFTSFLGYEWHSSTWGHVHIVYLEDHQPLQFAMSYAELQEHFRELKGILVPHHTAYLNHVDWALFDEQLSPVVEIYSEHGCSERDYGPFPMIGHSMGPGYGTLTAQHGLALGRKFGFIADTDTHDGYPGAYGQGLTGVWAEANAREAIFDAFRRRRTTAVTGDRVRVELRAGDAWMGESIKVGEAEELSFAVEGWDFIKQVELVRDNVPVWVQAPDYAAARSNEGIYRLRIEWGWGPMKGAEIFDWEGDLQLEDGRIQHLVPGFCSDPFDEDRRKRVVEQSDTGCRWQSHTSRGGVFTTGNSRSSCWANDALCLEVRGDESTRIQLRMGCQSTESVGEASGAGKKAGESETKECTCTIGELLDGSRGFKVGKPAGGVKIHRAVPRALYTMSGGYWLQGSDADPAYYYLRATQENGQMAWSSPIWFER